MEERKIKEIEYYDKQARERAGSEEKSADFEGFNPNILSSFRFCYDILKQRCQGKKLLDYGCGNGVHSVFPAKCGAEVTAIDLSEPSLEIAREKAQKEGLGDKILFLAMDCEKTDFPDNSFDIIFDGGTFSSLDISKALPELKRILKPNGFLLGIETFGHNPLTNLKRKLNKAGGKRTGWAADHIFKEKDIKEAEKHFNKIEIRHFHLTSWLAFPFLKFAFGKALFYLLEEADKVLLKIPFLRKYAFKAVFIFEGPKK